MTNKALEIEPNDPDAIAVQGEAMVEMGATARAQANLQKLQTIAVRRAARKVAQLSAAITARSGGHASAKVPETPKKRLS